MNNNEYDKYNNHMALFNNAYAEYEAHYNRNNMPISHGNYKLF